MTTLLGLAYSPWTEKARWALDARRVPYTFRPYQPLLGEPALRLALRRPTGTVSVPVLTTDDGQRLADSTDIARWAAERGEGPALFPPEHEALVTRCAALSQRALDAGRALSLRRMLADPEALAEMVPGPIRGALGAAVAARVGGLGVERTLRKYGGHRTPDKAHREALTAALDELRGAIATAPGGGAPKTLAGRFSFADIAAAQALAFVEPPAHGLRLGPASRRTFTDPALRGRYADLLAWRDALYDAFRGAVGGRRGG